jgi:hypothetical protein
MAAGRKKSQKAVEHSRARKRNESATPPAGSERASVTHGASDCATESTSARAPTSSSSASVARVLSASGLPAAARSPGPHDQPQTNHKQHPTETRVASVATHRRSVYDVHALSDEHNTDDDDQHAENAEGPAHHHDLVTRSDHPRIQGRLPQPTAAARGMRRTIGGTAMRPPLFSPVGETLRSGRSPRYQPTDDGNLGRPRPCQIGIRSY